MGLQQPDRDKLSAYVEYLALQEEKGAKEGLKHWKARRASSERAQTAWQINSAKCLVALKQILSRLEEMHRLAKSKSKAS